MSATQIEYNGVSIPKATIHPMEYAQEINGVLYVPQSHLDYLTGPHYQQYKPLNHKLVCQMVEQGKIVGVQ